jgi:hypothetical protein
VATVVWLASVYGKAAADVNSKQASTIKRR